MVRELVVLGTASSVPTRHRNHNGYLLNWDDQGFLFDPGEGSQRQLLLSPGHASRVTHICITHFHGDHVLGLPGILQRLSIDDRPRTVDLWYPAGGDHHVDAATAVSVWDPEELVVRRHPSQPGVLATGPPRLTAAALDHSTETLGYRVDEPPVPHLLPDRLAALGIAGPDVTTLQEQGWIDTPSGRVLRDEVSVVQPGNSVAVVMDTRWCDGALELADGVDLLVCESTFLSSEVDLARRYGHLTADQAGRLAAQAGARRLLLTHFSQRHPDPEAFAAEARVHHPDVVVARDLAVVEVPHRRHLDDLEDSTSDARSP